MHNESNPSEELPSIPGTPLIFVPRQAFSRNQQSKPRSAFSSSLICARRAQTSEAARSAHALSNFLFFSTNNATAVYIRGWI